MRASDRRERRETQQVNAMLKHKLRLTAYQLPVRCGIIWRGGSDMAQITAEQKDYIVAHINDRPRTAVAKAAGVSMTMLYRLVRTHGGEMRHDLSRRNPQHVEIVKKYYPTMTGSEIEARFGIQKNRADKIANELGIKHTPETQERIRQKIQDNTTNNRHKIDFKELGHKRSVRYKMEYYRKWEGKPQKTKLRLAETSYRVYKAKWNLVTRYGYIETTDACTLMYDRNTHRMNEQYYSDKYGLKFIEDE